MRGHIAKKGNRYYPVVSMRDAETGKRKVKWHQGHDRKKDAEQALTKVLDQLDAGVYVAPSRRTVKTFLVEEWLPAHRNEVRPSTFESYSDAVRAHLLPLFGTIELQKLSPQTLNAGYATLLEKGGRNGTPLSPRTVRYAHTILRKALKDAVGWNLVNRNPADAAKPPKQQPQELSTWTSDEVRRFLTHASDHRLYAAFFMLFTTGMRRGELLGLRWGDIDLDASRLRITRTWIAPNGKQQQSAPKTKRSSRQLALDTGTVATLRGHLERQQLDAALLGLEHDPAGLVFAEIDGTPLNPGVFSKTFKRLARAAKLPVIRLHDTRHTYATLALQAGVHPKIVSERLGHSSIAITLDTYSHAVPVLEESAAELVASLIYEAA